MSQQRDLEGLLDRWFAEGPSRVPDRVLGAVADRIERQPQRLAWRLHWRTTQMNPYAKIAAALVAVLVLAIGGLTILRPTAQVGGPAVTPIPLTAPTNSLAPGTYLVRAAAGQVTLTVPDGWSSPQVGGGSSTFTLHLNGGPAADSINVFFNMRRAAKDVACTEAPEPGVGSTAAAIVADLQADRDLQVAPTSPIRIGSLQGLAIDVTLGAGTTRTCPFSSGVPSVPLVVDTLAGSGPFWGIGPNEKERLVILDAPGGGNIVVVIDSETGPSFDQLVNATMPVLQTFEFSPSCEPVSGDGCAAGSLGAGEHQTRAFRPAMSFTVPVGWSNSVDKQRAYTFDAPGNTLSLQAMSQVAIPDQGADCAPRQKAGAGTAVADWMAFLTAHPGLVASAPTPLTLGGYAGQKVTFHVASTWAMTCPSSIGPAVLLVTDNGAVPERAYWIDDQYTTFYVIDVAGETVIIRLESAPAASASEQDQRTIQPILDSIRFSPGG